MSNPVDPPHLVSPAARNILSQISLEMLMSPEESYLDDFVRAVGVAVDAEMVMVSRIIDPEQPCTAYALYDRSGTISEYIYQLTGTPCERVHRGREPFSAVCGLKDLFPEDDDLVEYDLNAYIGVPLMHEKKCFGIIAALWRSEPCNPEAIAEVFRDVEPRLTRSVLARDLVRASRLDLEMQLAMTTQRLEIALGVSGIGVWEWNIDTGEIVWDRQMNQLYGRATDGGERTYDDWAGALHPEDSERARAELTAAVESMCKFETLYRIILPDGTSRDIRAAGQFVMEAERPHSMVGCNWDVSEDVALAAELARQRVHAENDSLAKTQFLTNMSHEIRTPLNGVLGMAQLLANTELSERQQSYLRVIQTSGASLVDLIEDMVDISKIESRVLSLRMGEFSLPELVHAAAATMSGVAVLKGLELTVAVDPQLDRTVIGDAKRVGQILLSLVANAVKFTDAGSVHVAATPGDGGMVSFRVTDTGPGISSARQERVFERFYQGDTSATRRHGGSGLGLAIARDLVQLADGRIGVNSIEGEGSEFWFELSLPCAVRRLPQAESSSELLALPPAPPGSGDPADPHRSWRVLVVEDIETNRLVIEGMLRESGYQTSIAENGLQALEKLQSGHFDAVLMDIQMPVMAGDEAIRQIRALQTDYSTVPIYALTADATSGARERLIGLGASRYFSKPLDLHIVIRTLAADLARLESLA